MMIGTQYALGRTERGKWRLVSPDVPHIIGTVIATAEVLGKSEVWIRGEDPVEGAVTLMVPVTTLVGHEVLMAPASPPAQSPVVLDDDEVDAATLTD